MSPNETTQSICENSGDAAEYWRGAVKAAGGNSAREGVWIVVLDDERHFAGCHRIESKVFRSPVLFADEVVKADCLKGSEEFILVHNRPDMAPVPDADSKARARAIILAGRDKGRMLLDYILCGRPDEEHPKGYFPLHRLRSFRGDDPFPPKVRKGAAA